MCPRQQKSIFFSRKVQTFCHNSDRICIRMLTLWFKLFYRILISMTCFIITIVLTYRDMKRVGQGFREVSQG